MKPTEKQIKLIREIEEHSGYPIKFRGTTKEEARKWISENIENMNKSEWAIVNGYE